MLKKQALLFPGQDLLDLVIGPHLATHIQPDMVDAARQVPRQVEGLFLQLNGTFEGRVELGEIGVGGLQSVDELYREEDRLGNTPGGVRAEIIGSTFHEILAARDKDTRVDHQFEPLLEQFALAGGIPELPMPEFLGATAAEGGADG